MLEVRSSAARSFVTSYYAQYVCCVQLCGAMFLISIKSIDFHNIFFFGRWALARITAWAGAPVCAQAFAAHLPNCSIQKIHTDWGRAGTAHFGSKWASADLIPLYTGSTSFTILGSYCEWPFAFALHPKLLCLAQTFWPSVPTLCC